MDVLFISVTVLKKEIIGSLPEIIGDESHISIVAAFEKILLEDSEVIMPMLDSFSNMNLDGHLQEQDVTIALSCIRTGDGENMPYWLKFVLLSTTPVIAGRIIKQIRDQLTFVGIVDSYSVRSKKLKGKSLADSTDPSLQFKNILCESILKELKSVDQPRYHKVVDVWFLMLIYNNGGLLQNDAKKMLKKKILDGCFSISLFDQCIAGNWVSAKDYFPSFIAVCEYLLSCKERLAREFSMLLYKLLFEEFRDTFSRHDVLGSLVKHIGSVITYEVGLALETLILLTSKYLEDLIPFSSHVMGMLDYMESFQDDNLYMVYEVFSRLALSLRSINRISSILDEVLMIIRK